MIFTGEHSLSLLPKIVFMTSISCASLLAGYLMFVDENSLLSWLKADAINGNFTRQVILMLCLVFYVSRLFITVFVFLKRKMVWVETIIISILMSLALFSFAKVGSNSNLNINTFDYIGIFLFLFGSYLNTASEYSRYLWKKNDENKGHLYTEGLFKYSMHINYFGDIILFSGLALITQGFSLLILPLVMALNFMFFIIPGLDKYLEKKYGEEFKEYAQRTKKFIPIVY